jgi:hypothetical protein
MSKARLSGIKKKMGRPPVGSTPVMVRLPPDQLADLDRWIRDIARRLDAAPTGRPEAIRDILQNHFDTQRQHWGREDVQKVKPSGTRDKSAGMAGRTIDAMADRTAPAEDRAKRKRRLLKGPKEFRDMRDASSRSRGPSR